MPVTFSLSASDLDDEALQKLTRQLSRDLRDEAGIESILAKQPAPPGAKGELEIIGQILVAAVGAGGAIVGLVNVLKAYVQRKPSLQIEMQDEAGRKLIVKADDLRAYDLSKLVQSTQKFFEDAK
jgi:hypothetical protein